MVIRDRLEYPALIHFLACLREKACWKVIFLAWISVMTCFAPAARTAESDRHEINAGYYDITSAHNDRAAVIVGATVTFKRLYLVKMLDQLFSVQTDMPVGDNCTVQKDGETKTVIIY